MYEITNSGWIEVITGCMFSGKTEELLRRLRRAEIAGHETTAVTPATDTRYGEEVLGSHAGREWRATIIDPESPSDIIDAVDDAQVVAVDEANFFEPALVEACEALAADGHRVIAAGLDQTFRGEPFTPVPELVAVAEYADKQRAVCACCGDPATRTQRLIEGEPAPADTPTIQVGGEESYEARCRDCHSVPGL